MTTKDNKDGLTDCLILIGKFSLVDSPFLVKVPLVLRQSPNLFSRESITLISL